MKEVDTENSKGPVRENRREKEKLAKEAKKRIDKAEKREANENVEKSDKGDKSEKSEMSGNCDSEGKVENGNAGGKSTVGELEKSDGPPQQPEVFWYEKWWY